MSEEIGNGVKIILSRIESNPEEFAGDYSPWRHLMNSVLNHRVNPHTVDPVPLRSLNGAEIDALYKAFLPIERQAFDSWVMTQVFNAGDAQEREAYQPNLFTQQAHRTSLTHGISIQRNTLQNNIQPGGYYNQINNGITTSATTGITLAADTTVQGTLDATPSANMIAKIKKGLGL